MDSKLANISTRVCANRGYVPIAGTIVLGSSPQKVLLRAIGPSLPFPGILANPTLELRDGNGGLLEANDDSIDSPDKQAIIDTTIPPTNDLNRPSFSFYPPAGRIHRRSQRRERHHRHRGRRNLRAAITVGDADPASDRFQARVFRSKLASSTRRRLVEI